MNPRPAFQPIPAGNGSHRPVPKLDREGEAQAHVPEVAQAPHAAQDPGEVLDLPVELPHDVPIEVGVDDPTDVPGGLEEVPDVPEGRGHILGLVPGEAQGGPGAEVGAPKAAEFVIAGLGAAPAVTKLLEGTHLLLIWRAWNTHPEIKNLRAEQRLRLGPSCASVFN